MAGAERQRCRNPKTSRRKTNQAIMCNKSSVKVRVKPGHQQDLLNAMLENAKCAAGSEPGCLQFNVAQDSQDQNLLHLYEVYRDLDAFEAHKKTPH